MSETETGLVGKRKWKNRATSRHSERFRIIAGLLSLIIGLLYALQITPAYKTSYFLGIFLIMVSCLQLAFGVALLLKPWEIDPIGRQRSAAAATRIAQRWFLADIAGKLLLIVLLILHIAGGGPRFGTSVFDLLALIIQAGALICLILLYRQVKPSSGNELLDEDAR
ncbi:MAG: hypothetical protein R3A46_13745 [Thermomicrobiales bacterium]